MSPDSILTKTDKGAEEIATRKHKLDPRLRTLLIMVNGAATAAQLAQKFAGIGDIQPLLAQLEKEGYVKAGGGAAGGDIKEVRMEVARALTAALGPEADAMTMKIEGIPSMDALRAYLEQRREMLTQALGGKAPAFWSRVETLTRA
jgi:hypothetical protein